MSNIRSRGIPVIEPNPELERTLRRMNQNLGIQDDEVGPQIPPLVNLMTLYYLIFVGKVRYADNIPLQALKSTIEDMKISQTLMGHLSCPLKTKECFLNTLLSDV